VIEALRSPRNLAAGLLVLLIVGVVVGVVLADRDPDRLVASGREALDAQQLATAEADFRQAVAADPTRVDALAGLGWTYLLAGEQAAAEAAFKRCAEVDPTQPECLRGQASVAQRKGKQEKGRGLLIQALKLAPDDAKVQSSLALLEMSQGDIDGAAARYESLVARHPQDAEYTIGLVEARLRQDRPQEALTLAEQALTWTGTPLRTIALLHLLRARILVKMVTGRVDPARCAETLPPVLAWLKSADASVDAAQATGVRPPRLGEVRRLVGRKRGGVEDLCPGQTPVIVPSQSDGG